MKAGDSNTTCADMVEEFIYTATGVERDIRGLMILDESIAHGKTAGAILEHLKRNGLPDEVPVALAAVQHQFNAAGSVVPMMPRLVVTFMENV